MTGQADRAAGGAAGHLARKLAIPAAAVAVLLPVVWALDPWRLMRGTFVKDQFLAAELCAAIAFVLWRAGGQARDRAAALLWLAGGAAAVVLGWKLVGHFGSDAVLFVVQNGRLLILALALMGLCLLAAGREIGAQTVVLVLLTLGLGYAAQFFDSPFDAAPIRADRYLVYMVFGGDGFLGGALSVLSGPVAIFLLFGAAYDCAGGTAVIDILARRLSRRGSGVAIKATVVSSGLFGMISGSATSNVLTSGAFTITAMRRMGVPAATAGGIEAVSSTIGQVTPPVMGAAAFLMADMTGISYGQIALAAAIPAILCFAFMFHQATWLGQRIEQGRVATPTAPALPWQAEDERLGWAHLWHLLPVVVITLVMFRGDRATELAGILGIVAAIGAGAIVHGPRRMLTRLGSAAEGTTVALTTLVIAGSALGVVMGVLNLTGLDVSLTLAIRTIGESSLFLSLLLTGAAAVVLGTGMSTTGVYIVVGTLLAPGLVSLGVPPIAAHLFVLYYGMLSMITPPVAFAVLAASGVSGASFSATAWAAMRFGWSIFVLPFVFVYVPELVLVGPPEAIAATLAGAAVFVGGIGWLLATTGTAGRAMAMAGLLLGATGGFFEGAPWTIRLALAALGAVALVAARRLAQVQPQDAPPAPLSAP